MKATPFTVLSRYAEPVPNVGSDLVNPSNSAPQSRLLSLVCGPPRLTVPATTSSGRWRSPEKVVP